MKFSIDLTEGQVDRLLTCVKLWNTTNGNWSQDAPFILGEALREYEKKLIESKKRNGTK